MVVGRGGGTEQRGERREEDGRENGGAAYLKVSIVLFIIIKASCIFYDCLPTWTKPIGQKLSSLKV